MGLNGSGTSGNVSVGDPVSAAAGQILYKSHLRMLRIPFTPRLERHVGWRNELSGRER